MSREERAARAKELADKPSRADRLAALTEKINPDAADEDGRWHLPVAPPWGVERVDEEDSGPEFTAPYLIRELDDGRQQIQIVAADGDVFSAVGATIEDALTSLEAKMEGVQSVTSTGKPARKRKRKGKR
jgi:hypothetical protein